MLLPASQAEQIEWFKDFIRKGKPGGNGNCKPKLELAEQLKIEGVAPLNPDTFCFSDLIYDGVPRKGEAVHIDAWSSG